jgi:hypothetical protein
MEYKKLKHYLDQELGLMLARKIKPHYPQFKTKRGNVRKIGRMPVRHEPHQ